MESVFINRTLGVSAHILPDVKAGPRELLRAKGLKGEWVVSVFGRQIYVGMMMPWDGGGDSVPKKAPLFMCVFTAGPRDSAWGLNVVRTMFFKVCDALWK